MEELVPFGSRAYLQWLTLLLFSRGTDVLSTWIATPNLVLEGNPLIKRLGVKWGIVLNVAVCILAAFVPFGAIVGTTTSLLIAARNFQSAWAVRTAGEERYRQLREQWLNQTPPALFLLCVFAEAFLLLLVGMGLIWASDSAFIPLGIGVGIVLYAFAVALFMSISLWRNRRPTH